MRHRILRTATATAFAVTLGTGLVACSSDGDGGNSAAGADGSNENAELRITTSTQVWADITDSVLEEPERVGVTAIIEGNDTDPHSYEPTARDMALVEQSDIIVVGGGHYDSWLASAAADTDALVISAIAVDEDGHDHDHDDDDGHSHGDDEVNEHVWYDVDSLSTVGSDLTGAVNDRLGDGAASMSTLDDDLEEIREKKEQIGSGTVVQAHPAADFILDGTALDDITPAGYRSATLAEAEPSAADVNAMLEIIESGDVDYFINTPQTADQVSARLLDAATSHGLRIVNVYEGPTENESFIDLYLSTLGEFAEDSGSSTESTSETTETSEDTDIPEATDSADAPATTDTTGATDTSANPDTSAEPAEDDE